MSTPTKIMVLLTSFGQRRAVPLNILILIVAMNGAQAGSRHSLSASQPASDSKAWFDLQRSVLAMHGAMSSIWSAGNDDEDFVRERAQRTSSRRFGQSVAGRSSP